MAKISLNEELVLEYDQVLDIMDLPGEFPYKTTNEDSILKGKTYRRFTYNGIVFIAQTDSKFCKLYDDEELGRVKLKASEDEADSSIIRLAVTAAVSFNALEKAATREAKITTIKNSAFVPTPVSAEMLKALED